MSVLLIFIDGIGVGQEDPSLNPFARVPSPFSRFQGMNENEISRRDAFFKRINPGGYEAQDDIMESAEENAIVRYPGFRQIFNKYRRYLLENKSFFETSPQETPATQNGVFKEIDPRMDVQGIPQSASGQASILTGLNIPAIIGHHLQGLPNKKVRELISKESIFLKLSSIGLRVTFANAFTDGFFKRKSPRISATTHAALSGGIKLRMMKDIKAGKAVYQDYTNFFLKEMGCDVELISPEKAGENLARLSAEHDFTLYEHFLTDLIGHRGNIDEGETEVLKLRSFIYSVLKNVDLSGTLVIVTSDHGNLEDMSLKTHTLNPVPLVCWGRQKEAFQAAVQNISDIGKNIISFLHLEP
jgi:hypothetical protein